MWEFAKKTGKALLTGALVGLAVYTGMSFLSVAAPEVVLGGTEFSMSAPFLMTFFGVAQAGAETLAPVIHRLLGDGNSQEQAPVIESSLEPQVAITNAIEPIKPTIDHAINSATSFVANVVPPVAADKKQSHTSLLDRYKHKSHVQRLLSNESENKEINI